MGKISKLFRKIYRKEEKLQVIAIIYKLDAEGKIIDGMYVNKWGTIPEQPRESELWLHYDYVKGHWVITDSLKGRPGYGETQAIAETFDDIIIKFLSLIKDKKCEIWLIREFEERKEEVNKLERERLKKVKNKETKTKLL